MLLTLSTRGSGEPPAQIDRAVRALVVDVVASMRHQASAEYRRGRHSDYSTPLPERLADPLNQLPYHGGPNSIYKKTHKTRAEGDELRAVFDLVVQKLLLLNSCGDKPRMSAIPKGADPEQFHGTYWRKFLKPDDCWNTMSISEQTQHLRQWIVKKFSLDPEHLSMTPLRGIKRKPRNDACWVGFWMTDQELDKLVSEVIQEVHVTSPAPGATPGKDKEKIIQLWEAQGSGVLALPSDTPLDIATANSLITARAEQNQREFLKAMGEGLQSISDDTLKQFKDKHYLLAIKQQWKETK